HKWTRGITIAAQRNRSMESIGKFTWALLTNFSHILQRLPHRRGRLRRSRVVEAGGNLGSHSKAAGYQILPPQPAYPKGHIPRRLPALAFSKPFERPAIVLMNSLFLGKEGGPSVACIPLQTNAA